MPKGGPPKLKFMNDPRKSERLATKRNQNNLNDTKNEEGVVALEAKLALANGRIRELEGIEEQGLEKLSLMEDEKEKMKAEIKDLEEKIGNLEALVLKRDDKISRLEKAMPE